jgi:(1->4)-alpha-D-glucan 1-alpha-D-glucosylmutase
MAKGVEDTAFYRFNRLIALNEVGGDPACFGDGVEAFHAACRARQARWPRAQLASSTHDTKRSEDVRARLALLSEMPARWTDAVAGWAAHNARHRAGAWPDRNVEYLLYQTLVGAWPLERERALAYMVKASREAKAHTSWTQPNQEYDEALQRFVAAVCDDAEFQRQLAAFVAPLIPAGRVSSLALTVLKLAAPGVPDFYQGTELWDLSLVDPDNRRPVDFARRRELLAVLDGASPEQILERGDDGVPKLWAIRQGLGLRRRHPDWFGPAAEYAPLTAAGARAAHAVAFARAHRVVAVVPRLVWTLNGDWADTTLTLPEGGWRDCLSGEPARGEVRLARLLARFPVALLEREEGA